jgi:hypothetical protein
VFIEPAPAFQPRDEPFPAPALVGGGGMAFPDVPCLGNNGVSVVGVNVLEILNEDFDFDFEGGIMSGSHYYEEYFPSETFKQHLRLTNLPHTCR